MLDSALNSGRWRDSVLDQYFSQHLGKFEPLGCVYDALCGLR
jgi:hypothetical protein